MWFQRGRENRKRLEGEEKGGCDVEEGEKMKRLEGVEERGRYDVLLSWQSISIHTYIWIGETVIHSMLYLSSI